MRKFVFWTGILNVVSGLGFVSGAVSFLGIKLPASGIWNWGLGAAIIYSGVVLVLCSRNLATRASLVYWEGFLRIVGFLLFVGFGFFGDFGIVTGILGIVELLIGLVYLIGLPKALNTTAANLLLDRGA